MKAKPLRPSKHRVVRGQPLTAEVISFSKQMRRTQTVTERFFWNAVRANRLGGLHFRRQQPIGDYIVDFYCEAARLAIELDGSSHELSGKYDADHDRNLARIGVKVLRISAADFRSEPDMVLGWILQRARERASELSRV